MSFFHDGPRSDLQANINRKVLESFESGAQPIHQVCSRFKLPANVVHSVCPAQRATAFVNVLPHIVLRGTDVPWSRSPTSTRHENEQQTTDGQGPAPWFVLLAFSPEELRLDEQELEHILHRIPSIKKSQSETFSVRVPARDTPQLSDVLSTIPSDEELDAPSADESLDVIFIKNDLFQSIFTAADTPTGSFSLDLTQYKSMTHVRRLPINSTDGSGAFSISISPRTGPIGLKTPETVVVHLVSVDMRSDLTLVSESKPVALTSLHSWTYTCLPDGQETHTPKCISNFAQGLTVLPSKPQDIPDTEPEVKALVLKKLEDGYSLAQHRTITGEKTTAIVRGPLIPKPVGHPLNDHFCMQSNFGSDLSIVDKDFGLTNITYSSAWELGHTMARNDQHFAAALMKLRSAVRAGGSGGTRIDLRGSIGGSESGKRNILGRDDLLKGLDELTQRLDGYGIGGPAASSNRWRSGRTPDATKSTPLTESTIHDDADFNRVYSWVLDKLHLKQVPWHYICLDASWLPPETLRFVYVDENWMDALVDGALSLGNLSTDSSSKDDSSRTTIKRAINSKLSLPDKDLGGRTPPTPVYGFVLRSQLLVEFPDIIVSPVFAEVPLSGTADSVSGASKPSILSQQKLDDDSMCCLFDSFPATLQRIILAVPPHQQSFIIGDSITEENLTVKTRPLFTQWDKEKYQHISTASAKTISLPLADGKAFDPKSRMLEIQSYANSVRVALRDTAVAGSVDSSLEANSALLALHLSETIPELVIRAPETLEDIPKTAEDRLFGIHPFQLSLPKGL